MRRRQRDAGFSEYVSGRRAHLRRTAYLLCGDVHLAEDLVQTTLMKLYVAWPRLDRLGSVDAYACKVLANVHIDETRRPWRRERASETLDEETTRPHGPVDDRAALTQALQALTANQRRVIVLRHFWGLSVEETARDLGCSTGNVKSQTSRALDRLEELLAPQFQHRLPTQHLKGTTHG